MAKNCVKVFSSFRVPFGTLHDELRHARQQLLIDNVKIIIVDKGKFGFPTLKLRSPIFHHLEKSS